MRNPSTGVSRVVVSGSDGRYQFSLMAPGGYKVTAEASGFRKFVDSGVRLHVAHDAPLNIRGGAGGMLIRDNPVAGQEYQLSSDQKSASRWFNTGAFVAPAAFQFGALGRNNVVRPGMSNLDLMVSREVSLKERLGVNLRAEFFNLPNHPNFNIVGRIINQPNFGAVLSQFDPRQIQFGAKVAF